MRKGLYSIWLVFIIAITLPYNLKAQHDKITNEVVTSFMDTVQEYSLSITEFLNNSTEYSTFLKTLKTTNSISFLESDTKFTVFAPNNNAFAQFPPEVMNQLFKPENNNKLRSIVDYHIVFGPFNLEEKLPKLNGVMYLTAINNKVIEVCLESEDALVIYDANDYPIDIKQKILLKNGVIYTIDAVLLPQVDVKVAYN